MVAERHIEEGELQLQGEWRVRAEAETRPLPATHDYFKMTRVVNIEVIPQD
jgi:hypothetical protein